MAKIKLLCARVGPMGSQNRGEVIEVDAAEASRMIAAGQAIPMQGEKREKQTKRMKGVEKRG